MSLCHEARPTPAARFSPAGSASVSEHGPHAGGSGGLLLFLQWLLTEIDLLSLLSEAADLIRGLQQPVRPWWIRVTGLIASLVF